MSICEIKSNSMISGTHKNKLPDALKKSHHSIIVRSHLFKWLLKSKKIKLMDSYLKIKEYIMNNKSDIDIILIMSNKSTKELRKYITNEKSNKK